MSVTFETDKGLVAFIDSDKYFSDGLFSGSMGAVSKETGAKIVLLLGEKELTANLTKERAQELVDMAFSSVIND